MNKIISGNVFVLGDDIDTDQIIPAQHLVYSLEKPEEKKMYGKFALSGVPEAKSGLPKGGIPFTPDDQFESEFTIVVAGKNFGCGSSREHAPFAMQVAGCKAVIASTYARIFYRNAVDGGFLVPFESFDDVSHQFRTYDEVEIDTELNIVRNLTTGVSFPLRPLGDVADIVEAGGIFAYARKHNMIKQRE